MIFCTSICANYLPKAMVLAKTLKSNNPNARIVVCLVEDRIENTIEEFEYFDSIVLAKEIGIRNYESFMFKHTIIEASTAVKGDLFTYLMEKYKEEDKFIYLDPDIAVFSSFSELENILEEHEIVLTPHTYCPDEGEKFNDSIFLELNHLKRGVYNLGFLGIRRGKESGSFINWWRNRLNMLCYDQVEEGLFVDQKWIDLAPALFDVYILKEPGYNLAYWNLEKRNITIREDNAYAVNGKPLIFVHFSGWDSGFNDIAVSTYAPNANELMNNIKRDYNLQLLEMDMYGISKIKWSYNCYHNGEKISNSFRMLYRKSEMLQHIYNQPFIQLNKEIEGHLEKLYNIQDCDLNYDKWSVIEDYVNQIGCFNRGWVSEKRIELSVLKPLLDRQKRICIIWGAGGGGKIMKKLLDEFFENVKIVGFIDKYKEGYFEGYPVYKTSQINELTFNYVFIATSPGKVEAENNLNSIGSKIYNDYYSLF